MTDLSYLGMPAIIRKKIRSRQEPPAVMIKYYKSNWVASADVNHAQDILKQTYYIFTKWDEEVHEYLSFYLAKPKQAATCQWQPLVQLLIEGLDQYCVKIIVTCYINQAINNSSKTDRYINRFYCIIFMG